MTKTQPKPKTKFTVRLKPRKGEAQGRTVDIHARYLHVNHRGDLVFSNASGYDPCVVACLSSGSWVSVLQHEDNEVRNETT